ncbi:MAG: hypothetical protein NC548_22955 [Lachnospiraceae bacterium]|nr:hypothetical protein [Lachnospiraceae bacterium]
MLLAGMSITLVFRSIVVDTCFTNDTMRYETGIQINGGEWVIVAYYDTEDEAVKGHDHWCNIMKYSGYRNLDLLSVQTGETYHFPQLKIGIYIDDGAYTKEYCQDMQDLLDIFESAGRIKFIVMRGSMYVYACKDEKTYNLIDNLGFDGLFETTDNVE